MVSVPIARGVSARGPWAILIASSMALLFASCQPESDREGSVKKPVSAESEDIIPAITSKGELRTNAGRRVMVHGTAFLTKRGPGIDAGFAAFRFEGVSRPTWEQEQIGRSFTVSGVVTIVDEHIVPVVEGEEEYATDEPPGTLIPEKYFLRDVKIEHEE